MSSGKVKNMAASVKNRLLDIARQNEKPFQSLLIQYGLERFLFRLSQTSFKEKFILKGGLLLVGMGIPQARFTKDIDLLGLMPGDYDSVSGAVQEIGKVETDDGLVYDFTDLRIETMAENSEYPGIRLTFIVRLGQAKIPMQIDVGFGDSVVPPAKEMTFPTLLDMEPPVLKAYSVETIIAEKFEASLDLADINSRMKDFYDIWMLSRKYPFQGLILQEAITATCRRRKTSLSSKAEIFEKKFAERSDKQSQWVAFLRKTHLFDISENFSTIIKDNRIFLYPVAKATEKEERFEKKWPPGGPWESFGGSQPTEI